MMKKYSLNNKIKAINFMALLVISLLILISILAAVNGMQSFSDVLEQNDVTREFWSAVEDEGEVFRSYIDDEKPASYDLLIDAEKRTNTALNQLPYEYNQMSIDQYILMNSIHKTYQKCKELQDNILSAKAQDEEYRSNIAMYYMVQEYLESYAGNLQTMTVANGSGQYRRQKVLFYIIPGICIITGIMVAAVFVWLRYYIGKTVIKPVMALSEEAKRISEKDFSGSRIEAKGEDEIAVLVNSFEDMKESTRNYITAMEEKHQIEKQLVETRYQMLKNQINPHFLFNTLNLIASTAEIEDANTTEKMIVTLSRLFRYNLKSQGTVMPLEQELKVVADYMYLQQMRFGQRIQYSMDIAPEVRETLVPSFVLQPLVENAVIHGLSKRSQGGRIHIRCWKQEDTIWISVADTGEGISQSRLEELRRKLAGKEQISEIEEDDKMGTGLGLSNIAERIQSMYEKAGIQLHSSYGHGTVIQLYLK